MRRDGGERPAEFFLAAPGQASASSIQQPFQVGLRLASWVTTTRRRAKEGRAGPARSGNSRVRGNRPAKESNHGGPGTGFHRDAAAVLHGPTRLDPARLTIGLPASAWGRAAVFPSRRSPPWRGVRGKDKAKRLQREGSRRAVAKAPRWAGAVARTRKRTRRRKSFPAAGNGSAACLDVSRKPGMLDTRFGRRSHGRRQSGRQPSLG